LAGLFAREVLSFLVGRELLSPEWAERILSWPHTGFNVHSLVRTKTKAGVCRLSVREWMGRSHLRFGRPFSHSSLELTVPSGRKYIPGVIKREETGRIIGRSRNSRYTGKSKFLSI
jgi:hypothetical protein